MYAGYMPVFRYALGDFEVFRPAKRILLKIPLTTPWKCCHTTLWNKSIF